MRLGYTGLSCQHLSRKLSIAKVQVIFRGFLKTLHEKPYFFFQNVLKKWSFQKSRTGILSFLYHQERWYFSSPKIWSYSFGGKWKMIFFKKILGNMMYSSDVLKRCSFQKNRTGIWSFFHYQERWRFFFPKIWYFFYGRKMRDNISQKVHGNMMFSVFSVKIVFIFPTNMKLLFCQKSKDDHFDKNPSKDGISNITQKDNIHPRKNDIAILDWHSRKGSNDSLYFYGDLFKCFYIKRFPMKKTPETWYIGLKFDFICKLYGWRYSTMKNPLYPVPSSLLDLYLKVCLRVN